MANVKQYNQIMNQMRDGEFSSVYLLYGEEPYYIDKISKFIETHAIEEHERDFNLNIFYGRDLNKDNLLETLRRFPMMAQRQVVIIREAQDYSGKWSDLETYFQNPVASTLFVVDFKYKKVDARLKWVKAVQKNGIAFESSKHYDSDLPDVITQFARIIKYRINPAASFLMAEYLGNDLEKIEMELEKLSISVPLSKEITQDDVRQHIGMSREFSAFDYVDALADKDSFRSFQIAYFLGKNEKNNPMVLVLSAVFNHFSRLMMYHGLKQKDMSSVQSLPGVRSPFVARKVMRHGQNFTPLKTAQIIRSLREFDARAKGVESATARPLDLLKELTYTILN